MKTNLDKFYKTDAESEKTGVWMMLNDETGFLLKPFRPTNPQVKKALATYYKPVMHQINNGTLSDDKDLEIRINMFLSACLVDWKGVEIDGVDTAYEPKIALQFFKTLPDLFGQLWDFASKAENYRAEMGNS